MQSASHETVCSKVCRVVNNSYWPFFDNNAYIGNVFPWRLHILGGYHGHLRVSSNYICIYVYDNQGYHSQ